MIGILISIGGGFSLIIYSISLFAKILRKEAKNKIATRKSALTFLFLGLSVFVGGVFITTYLRDKNQASPPHHLYKDLTFDEWKVIVNEAMSDYRDCTKSMDKGSYQFQSICIQSVSYKGNDFKTIWIQKPISHKTKFNS